MASTSHITELDVTGASLKIGGVLITSTPEEINILDGATVTTEELNKLDGLTSSTTELNILDGLTSTNSELNSLDIDSAKAVSKMAAIDITASDHFDGTETSISYTFPAKAVLREAYLDVTTGHGSTATLNVGISSDPDGILDGIDIETAGVKVPSVSVTVGTFETFISAVTYGLLTHFLRTGSDIALDIGLVFPRPSFVGGETVTVTSSSDLSGGSAAATLILNYIEIL